MDLQTDNQLYPWKKYLPSKKIGIALVVIVVAFGIYGLRKDIVVLINKVTNREVVKTSLPIPLAGIQNQPAYLDRDSDGDGILDWQELLIGTDPYTFNSKDSVSDDIRQLIAAADPVIDLSDKLALAIFERAETIETGTTYEEKLQAAASKEMLDLADSIDRGLTTYALQDLNLEETALVNIANYASTMTTLLDRLEPSETTIQKTYAFLSGEAPSPDAGYLTLLAQSIERLIAIQTPLALSEPHLALTNALAHSYEIIKKQESLPSSEINSLVNMFIFQKNFNLALQAASDVVGITTILKNQ